MFTSVGHNTAPPDDSMCARASTALTSVGCNSVACFGPKIALPFNRGCHFGLIDGSWVRMNGFAVGGDAGELSNLQPHPSALFGLSHDVKRNGQESQTLRMNNHAPLSFIIRGYGPWPVTVCNTATQ